MAKICILLDTHWGAGKGGAEYQAHCLAEHLVRTTRHEVVYLAAKVPEDVDGYMYRIERIPSLVGGMRYRLGYFADSPSLYLALRRLRPDVVIQRVAGAYTGVAAFYCRGSKTAMIWHVANDPDVEATPELGVHGIARSIDTALLRYGARHANFIITQSATQARLLEATYQRSPTAIIPNFHPLPARGSQKDAQLTLLWISALKPHKQPEMFVKLAQALAAFPDIKFKLIGRSAPNKWSDSVLQLISATPNLEYLGELEMDDVNKQLDRAHIAISTSLYEGFSNVFIQAWMREVPVLSLNIDPDGVMEKFGLGFRTGTLENLKSRVLEFYHDRDLLKQTGMRAKAFADANYSLKNADRIVTIIDNALMKSALLPD